MEVVEPTEGEGLGGASVRLVPAPGPSFKLDAAAAMLLANDALARSNAFDMVGECDGVVGERRLRGSKVTKGS
jgi:hypothetical protein